MSDWEEIIEERILHDRVWKLMVERDLLLDSDSFFFLPICNKQLKIRKKINTVLIQTCASED